MAESMLDEAHDWMKQLFAPWVQSLGLKPVKVQGGEAELLLPFDPALCRVGGTICGQALMAAADTAMVFAIASQLGEFRPMTTVSQNMSFMRPVSCWRRARVGARAQARSQPVLRRCGADRRRRRQAGGTRHHHLCHVVTRVS